MMKVTDGNLIKILERLRARATLYKTKPKDIGEEMVGRALDEVADAIEETLNEPAEYDDDAL